MSDEKRFVKGMFIHHPGENAPEWVKADIGVRVEELVAWLLEQERDMRGFVQLSIKEAKGSGRLYAELNTGKMKGAEGRKENEGEREEAETRGVEAGEEDSDDSMPF